jgi:hypothetical protein
LGSHGLGSHLVVPPTGNPPIGLGNRSQPNWDEGPTQLGHQNPVNKAIFTCFKPFLTCFLKLLLKFHIIIEMYLYRYYYNSTKCPNIALNIVSMCGFKCSSKPAVVSLIFSQFCFCFRSCFCSLVGCGSFLAPGYPAVYPAVSFLNRSHEAAEMKLY